MFCENSGASMREWDTGEDTVTIQGTDGDLIFKFTDGK